MFGVFFWIMYDICSICINRYRRLDKMEDERDVILINHLGFLECPSSEQCYYKELCAETQVQSVLETAAKTVKWVTFVRDSCQDCQASRHSAAVLLQCITFTITVQSRKLVWLQGDYLGYYIKRHGDFVQKVSNVACFYIFQYSLSYTCCFFHKQRPWKM